MTPRTPEEIATAIFEKHYRNRTAPPGLFLDFQVAIETERAAVAVPPPGCIIDRDAEGKAVVRKVFDRDEWDDGEMALTILKVDYRPFVKDTREAAERAAKEASK